MEHHKELLNLNLGAAAAGTFSPAAGPPHPGRHREAGPLCPSSMNRQACRFFVLTDTALIQSISAW